MSPLPPETVAHLRVLHERLHDARVAEQQAKKELWREVRRVKAQEGVTVRAIADALGVSSGTVGDWLKGARQLDDG